MSLKIKWLGHAGFRLAFNDHEGVDRVIYIDTWLENPKLPAEFKGKVPDDADLVLVTHGHFDHSSSAPAILNASTKAGSKIVAVGDLNKFYQKHHAIPVDRCEGGNKGGTS